MKIPNDKFLLALLAGLYLIPSVVLMTHQANPLNWHNQVIFTIAYDKFAFVLSLLTVISGLTLLIFSKNILSKIIGFLAVLWPAVFISEVVSWYIS